MHAWDSVFPGSGQSVWHRDNDHYQQLHDKPAEGEVRAVSPRYARSREQQVGDQTHYREGSEEHTIYSNPIQEKKHQCQPGRNRPK